MSDREAPADGPSGVRDRPGADTSTGVEDVTDVPDWEDEYVDRVSDRLLYNYDLEKEYTVEGERFTLYGKMELLSKKHFLHPSLSFAHHESTEHLFVRRTDQIDDRTLDRFVDLGNRLADEWIEPDESHFCTEFTFVAVAPSIPDGVRERVSTFDGRTLLKLGYHGHYEINLVVVAPDEQELVANDSADVATAFRLWDDISKEEPGILDLIARRLQL